MDALELTYAVICAIAFTLCLISFTKKGNRILGGESLNDEE